MSPKQNMFGKNKADSITLGAHKLMKTHTWNL